MPNDRRPLRDVYSGDVESLVAPQPVVRAIFEVRVDADPGALTRVAAILAFSNVAPLRVSCERESPDDLVILAVFECLATNSADLILRKLRQLSVVTEVTLLCENEQSERVERQRGV